MVCNFVSGEHPPPLARLVIEETNIQAESLYGVALYRFEQKALFVFNIFNKLAIDIISLQISVFVISICKPSD